MYINFDPLIKSVSNHTHFRSNYGQCSPEESPLSLGLPCHHKKTSAFGWISLGMNKCCDFLCHILKNKDEKNKKFSQLSNAIFIFASKSIVQSTIQKL